MDKHPDHSTTAEPTTATPAPAAVPTAPTPTEEAPLPTTPAPAPPLDPQEQATADKSVAPAAITHKASKKAKPARSGSTAAIVATVVIVLGLACLITYAYLQTNK